jgi:uncharacterized protein (TIGR01244 family)
MSKNRLAFVIATMGVAFWATMLVLGATPLHAPQDAQAMTRVELPGVRNMTQVDATIACAGATDAAAIPEIAKRGYKSIINLRLASERDADIDAAAAAAASAGIRFIHLPFEVANPDAGIVDRFIAAVSDSANQPVFIHCGSGSRAAGLLMIKRVIVDGWDAAKAEAEARAIGLSSPKLRDWVLAEIAKRKR